MEITQNMWHYFLSGLFSLIGLGLTIISLGLIFSQPALERFSRSLFGLRPHVPSLQYIEWLDWQKAARAQARLPRWARSADDRAGEENVRNGQAIWLGGCAFGGLPKGRRARFCQKLRPLPAPRRAFNLRPTKIASSRQSWKSCDLAARALERTPLRRAHLQVSRWGGRMRRYCRWPAQLEPTWTRLLQLRRIRGQLAEEMQVAVAINHLGWLRFWWLRCMVRVCSSPHHFVWLFLCRPESSSCYQVQSTTMSLSIHLLISKAVHKTTQLM